MAIQQIHDLQSMQKALREGGRKPVAIVFMSPTCVHCRNLMIYVQSLCQDMPDVDFKKVDISSSKDIAKEFYIDGVPCTFLYKNGSLHYKVSGNNPELLRNNLMHLKE